MHLDGDRGKISNVQTIIAIMRYYRQGQIFRDFNAHVHKRGGTP